MTISKERLKQELEQMNDNQLQQIADFMEFLKFRDRQTKRSWQPLLDSLDRFSGDFMNTREQPALEVREIF